MKISKKTGFTLIELLVVVLIIGILAAVALPQYQVSVGKARLMEGMVTLRALKDAQILYKMENGDFTSNLEDLSIAVDESQWEHIVCARSGGFYCAAWPKNSIVGVEVYPGGSVGNQFSCLASKSNAVANRICKSFGTWQRNNESYEYYYMK